MQEMIVDIRRCSFVGGWQRVAERKQESECIFLRKVMGGHVPFRKSIGIVCSAEGRLQLRINVVIKAEVGAGKCLFQNRGPRKQSEGSTLHSVWRDQQYFAIAFEESSGDMATGIFSESDCPIVERNVQ